ncbi:MAG: hypothetical protein ACTSW4_06460, partial [Candidatus Ranarchaeia archaeon]
LENHFNSINQCFPTVDEVLVIVGSFADKIKAHIRKVQSKYDFTVTIIPNNAVHRENGYSLFLANKYVTEKKFYFAMADHFAAPSIYETLQTGPEDKLVVCADTNPSLPLPRSSVKLRLDKDNRLLKVGLRLRCWDAIDTGFFQGTQETFSNLASLEEKKPRFTVTDVVRLHVENKTAEAVLITGDYWVNINTYVTLKQAEKTIIKEHPYLIPGPWAPLADTRDYTALIDKDEETLNA